MRRSPRSLERTWFDTPVAPGGSRRRRLVAQELDGGGLPRFPKKLGETEPTQDSLGQLFATSARERKRLHHDRADLVLDIVAQHGAGAVQPGLYGLRLQPENLRGLLDIHPLDHAGDDDQTKR